MPSKQVRDFAAVVTPATNDKLLVQQTADNVTRYMTPAQILALLATVSQAEAEAGSSTTPRSWTAERVKQAILALTSNVLPRSYLAGLTLANNGADATNDIDIAAGKARDSTDVSDLVLSAPLTKRLDAAWAVGTNQGGRMSAAAITDTTYHVFAIKNDVSGVVDIGFDVSPTAPTMPADHTLFRRIGSSVRLAGVIKPFVQHGDFFQWLSPPLDIDITNPGTGAVTRTLTVPVGIIVLAVMNVGVVSGVTSTTTLYLSDLATTDLAASATVAPLGQIRPSATSDTEFGQVSIRTNALGQIRSRVSVSNVDTGVKIAPVGWSDRRGRDD